jgi:hypothetical protein
MEHRLILRQKKECTFEINAAQLAGGERADH